MNLPYKNITYLFVFASIFLNTSLAMEGAQQPTDPFWQTNYRVGLSPEILRKYQDVLEHDGTIANMPDGFIQEDASSHRIQIMDPGETYPQRREEMVQALLKQLKSAKRDAVLRPVYEAGIIVAAQGLATGAILATMPMDSMGGGFGLFAFMNLLGWVTRDSGKAFYAYMRPGNDPLDRWERMFAERMTMIPHRLWDQVIDMFGASRMGRFSYAHAQDYFKIAFNLPMLYRFPYVPPLKPTEIDEKMGQLGPFIDIFFQDYENGGETAFQLKAAMRAYLSKLAKNHPGFVCIHLLGRGGIGKTHFVRKIIQFMKTIDLPLPMEEINIRGDSATALEGDKGKPGQVLSALSRLGATKKPYGTLVFDEAEWLNEKDLTPSAKKMFEPSLGSFTSEYLNGLEVSLQGYLLWFMSNSEIEDPALKSRFINVNFPTLKQTSIQRMTHDLLPNLLAYSDLTQDTVKKDGEYLQFLKTATDMRQVDTTLPTVLEKIREKKNQ